MQPKEIAEYYIEALKKELPNAIIHWEPFPPYPESNPCGLVIADKNDTTKMFRYEIKDGLSRFPLKTEIELIKSIFNRYINGC